MPSSHSPRAGRLSKHPFMGFPAGEPHYRAARLRAALACREYNDLPEDVSAEERAKAWNKITKDNLTTWTKSLESVSSTAFVGNSVYSSARSQLSQPNCPTSKPDIVDSKTPLTANAQHVNDYPGYGQAPFVKGPVWVDYGVGLQIDGTTFINRNCTFLDTPHTVIRIGEKCSIGPGCHFYGVTHPLDPDIRTDPQNPNTSIASDITIGDRCWIGGNVTVLPGVTIGDGCVIGAGSVVTKSISEYTLAYGVPARPRRKIPRSSRGEFDPRELERLGIDNAVNHISKKGGSSDDSNSGSTLMSLLKHRTTVAATATEWPPISQEDLAETEQSYRRRHENAEWYIRMLVLFNALLFAAVVWIINRSCAIDAGGNHAFSGTDIDAGGAGGSRGISSSAERYP